MAGIPSLPPWLALVVLGFFLLLAFYFRPVNLLLHLGSSEGWVRSYVEVNTLWGLVRYRQLLPGWNLAPGTGLPSVRVQLPPTRRRRDPVLRHWALREILRQIRKMQQQAAAVQALLPPLYFLWRRARWLRLKAVFRLGTGDAATTAWGYGALWGAVSTVVVLLFMAKPGKPSVAVRVEPDFRQRIWAADVDCIFQVRLGDIMVASGYALGLYFLQRIRKGGLSLAGAPHPGSYENGYGKH